MKQVLKKLTPFVLALVMLVVLGTYVKADTADEAAEAAALLENIRTPVPGDHQTGI